LGLDESDFTISQDGADVLITLNSNAARNIRLLDHDAADIDGDDFVDLPGGGGTASSFTIGGNDDVLLPNPAIPSDADGFGF